MARARLSQARAQPDLGHAWAVCFSTQAGLKRFISAHLIDEPGLNSVVESPKPSQV